MLPKHQHVNFSRYKSVYGQGSPYKDLAPNTSKAPSCAPRSKLPFAVNLLQQQKGICTYCSAPLFIGDS